MKRFAILTSSLVCLLLSACNDGASVPNTAKPNGRLPGDETSIGYVPGDAFREKSRPPGTAGGQSDGGTSPGRDLNAGGDPPTPSSPVPEPGTLLLVGSGLAGLAALRRRRRGAIAND